MSIPQRMRSATIAAALTIALTSGVTRAQEKPKAAPVGVASYAFFSSSPEFPLTGVPKDQPTYLDSLTTRLNTENVVFAYVYNPSEREENVVVSLHSGSLNVKSRPLLAQSATSFVLKPKDTKRVTFAAAKVAAVAAAPAVPPAAEKPKDAEPAAAKPRGQALPPSAKSLYLRVVGKDKPVDEVAADGDAPYEIVATAPVGFTVEARAANKAIEVVVSYKATEKRLSNAPVKVRLDLRRDLNPGLLTTSGLEGTFAAELPALEKDDETATATLVAKEVVFNPTPTAKVMTFSVTIDGYDRAYLFETALNGTQPKPIGVTGSPVGNVRLSSYAQVPGKPVTVTVEADGFPVPEADGLKKDVPVELLVGRAVEGKGEVKPEVLRRFPASRSRETFALVGEDGSVTLTPVVRDWAVEFPTAQVVGKRAFAVRPAGTDSKPPAVLVIDRTPPEGVAFVAVPKKTAVIVGETLNFSAVAKDAESEIDKVFFFTGDTPPALDGKPAAGSRVIPGVEVLAKDKPLTYTTKEPLRLPETKGELRVGVVAFNKVGLSSVAELTLYVTTKPLPPEKPTTGSILGRAVQGGRPQPGLPVTLTDAAGKVVKVGKSDDLGKFEFKDLPPGSYTVVAVKKTDANASGKATVEVKASKDPTLIPELTVKR